MKSIVKALIVAVCAVVLFSASMMGTAAYFTAGDSSSILFSVGQVNVTLTTPYASDQKVIPGTSNQIEPIVNIQEGSVDAYVRVFVTLEPIRELDQLYGGDDGKLEFTDMVDKLGEGWTYKGGTALGGDARTYELRYQKVVSEQENIPAPFKSIVFPGDTVNAVSAVSADEGEAETNELMEEFKMTIEAEAIQAGGSATSDEAWNITG